MTQAARTTAITGSASGIGAGVRKYFEARGDRVIGVDLKDAEILADLSHRGGRDAAIRQIKENSSNRLDRLIVCAGLGTHVLPPSLIASVNYFGAVDLMDGLLETLAGGEQPGCVAICSNSAQFMQFDEDPFVQALLDHDEDRARALIDEADNTAMAYMGSKNALGKAIRRRAPRWGKAGVRLNAVAPGPVKTPLLQGSIDHPVFGEAVRNLDIPLGRMAEPEEIAPLVGFLLGPDGAWIHGSIYYIDGGNDATVRPDRF